MASTSFVRVGCRTDETLFQSVHAFSEMLNPSGVKRGLPRDRWRSNLAELAPLFLAEVALELFPRSWELAPES